MSKPFPRHSRSALSLAVAAAIAMSNNAAAQQATSDDGLVEVTITGIRAAIETAIAAKKESESIAEVVSAEDIGKLPDTSIAESIARLPGVAAQRTGGRAQQISIRGFGPDFTTGLLNGRQQVSVGDSRAVEYDQYPSELVNQVDILKSTDAALVGQGLAGTVNIQTVRPLSRDKMTIAGNYRRQKIGVGTVAEGEGDRYNLAYIDQFADGKVGVAVGFARLDETGATTSRFESWGGGQTTFAGATVNVPYNGFNAWADQNTQKRDGAMAVLEFAPSDSFKSTVDLFYAKFTSVTATKGFQAPLNDSWSSGDYDRGGTLTAATVSGGNVTAGTFNNVRAVVRNDASSNEDELNSIGWSTEWKAGDITVKTDLSYSKAEKNGAILETTAGTAQSAIRTAQLDSIQFTNAGVFTPGLDYSNRSIIKLTDVQGWGGGPAIAQAGYSKLPFVSDEVNSVRIDLSKDTEGGFFSSIEGGIDYTSREKQRSYVEGRLVIASGGSLASAEIPGTGSTTVNGIKIATFNPVGTIGSIYRVESKRVPDIYNKDWTVEEKLLSAYLKGNIEGTLWGNPVRGNLGVQVINTDQSSTAFNVSRSATCAADVCPATENSAGDKFTDFLPSLNLIMDLGDDQQLRFSLARQMARPTMNDMRASFDFGYDPGQNRLGGGGGNPELKPFRATALDLRYEKYWDTKAYVGVAGFYKDLSTYIVRIPNPQFDFTRYITASSGIPNGVPRVGTFTAPANGSGGSIKGIELSSSFPLSMVADFLDGFGIEAGYAYTDSQITLPTGSVTVDNILTSTIPLPGLSENVGDITLYYAKSGFEIRLAQRYRSSFVGEVSSFTGDRQLTYIKSEKILDGQLSYEIQSGIAKGLQLQFQAQNLTDEPYVRYRDSESNIIERVEYGKTYLFGINYRY
jgi:iron complex outermembrane receptor protein